MTTSTSTYNALNSGKFVTVTYTTKLGASVTINGRTGVNKYPTKSQPLRNGPEYLTIYCLKRKGFYPIKRDSIVQISAEGFSVGMNQSSQYARKIKA
jgi:hypothetical protein